MQETAAAGL